MDICRFEQAWHRDLGKAGEVDEEDFYRLHHGQREAFTESGHLERMPTVARGYIERYLDNYPQEPQNLKDL
jgi:hypothetical protein